MEKKKQAPVAREQEIKAGVDCLMQHLKAFHKQSEHGEIADFAKPCATCPFLEKCKCDWQGKIFAPWNPTDIKLNLCVNTKIDRRVKEARDSEKGILEVLQEIKNELQEMKHTLEFKKELQISFNEGTISIPKGVDIETLS